MPGNKFKWNSYNDDNLVAAFDMSTRTAGGLMKNLAKTGAVYDAVINGAFTPANPLIRAKTTPCMDFGGVNEYLSLANPMNGLGAFTIIGWLNIDAGSGCIFCQPAAADLYGFYNGTFQPQIRVGAGALITSRKAIPILRTFMYAVTFSAGNLYLYLDGQPVGYVTGGVNPVDANLRIGIFNGLILPLNGRLDNMLFFNIALTPDQIQSIWRSANVR
jgi:hypothetical protein